MRKIFIIELAPLTAVLLQHQQYNQHQQQQTREPYITYSQYFHQQEQMNQHNVNQLSIPQQPSSKYNQQQHLQQNQQSISNLLHETNNFLYRTQTPGYLVHQNINSQNPEQNETSTPATLYPTVISR